VTRDESLVATSMPVASPSYPKGPYRFIDREYLLLHYETEPDAIREMLPEPLEHVNCRAADLPVRKVLFGQHLIADLTLPNGEVLLDHLT
jgi:acetoacetate decarboxylase